MTTLNEAIQAKVAQLEAEASAVRSRADADIAGIQTQIDEAKAHLAGLAPYLERELSAAKDAVVAFFEKLAG
jgi:hypothetical protein